MTYYQKAISEMPEASGYDPRHVEAFIRLEHSTLGGLTAGRFKKEVKIAVACIRAGGADAAERCAKSFGL